MKIAMANATMYITLYQRKGRPGNISGLSHEGKLTASGMNAPISIFYRYLQRPFFYLTGIFIKIKKDMFSFLLNFIITAMALHDHPRENNSPNADFLL
jgi:hypothetical protein